MAVDALLAATWRLTSDEQAAASSGHGNDRASPWSLAGPFRVGVPAQRTVRWQTADEAEHAVTVT
ncbi:MAG: hypothetical protein WBP29_01450, partial [Candidatus Zixiibacteriota bacterium]